MYPLELFETEELIAEAHNQRVILTTQRIRFTGSDKYVVSIMLEKISSIEIRYKNLILLLILGIAFIACGFIPNGGENAMITSGSFTIGTILILSYFLTRKHIVTITPDGGNKINFETRGWSTESVLDFIHKVENAKSNRYSLSLRDIVLK